MPHPVCGYGQYLGGEPDLEEGAHGDPMDIGSGDLPVDWQCAHKMALDQRRPQGRDGRREYYELNIYIPDTQVQLLETYRTAARNHNAAALSYIYARRSPSAWERLERAKANLQTAEWDIQSGAARRVGAVEGAKQALDDALEAVRLASAAPNVGFDLVVPVTQTVNVCRESGVAAPINLQVRCCMRKVTAADHVCFRNPELFSAVRGVPSLLKLSELPLVDLERVDSHVRRAGSHVRRAGSMAASPLTAYVLYPNPHVASTTAMRLANAVEVVEGCYGGDIQVAVDIHTGPGGPSSCTAPQGLKLVRICPPSLGAPIFVRITTDMTQLGAHSTAQHPT